VSSQYRNSTYDDGPKHGVRDGVFHSRLFRVVQDSDRRSPATLFERWTLLVAPYRPLGDHRLSDLRPSAQMAG
jgi:hypothetical protein